MHIEWNSELYNSQAKEAHYFLKVARRVPDGAALFSETVSFDGVPFFASSGEGIKFDGQIFGSAGNSLVAPYFFDNYRHHNRANDFRTIFSPVCQARHVHLSVEALRTDSMVTPEPKLAPSGENLASLIAFWLLERPQDAQSFNEIISNCLPEMRYVHARSVTQGTVRLSFEQRDGRRFDSTEVSDGVLVFSGLIAHALQAPPNGLVLLEEPERGIHPRRLGELVDLLRKLVEERGTQFVLATHSPALLNHFRDEPEAILTFRRGANGTVITRLGDLPDLADTLARTDPGELLSSGAFNEGETTNETSS